MNAARIFLNGTDYTPDVISDLNDLGEHIWYDTERKAFLQEITGTITLGGQGFRYFQNLLRTNYDTQVPCTLSRFDDYAGVWQTVLHGLVFVTDCKFDLYAQTVEVQLVDNSYFAKIENNKGIKFVIGSGSSKNGVNITGVATSTQIKVLDDLPTPPLTYLPNTVTGWSRYEAMKFLVAAMTDNEVGFYSDFLQDYLDPVQNVLNNGFLFSGEALRAGPKQYGPNISFEYCYGDLAKLYNLVQYIERDSNGNLRLRVEKFDNIRQSNVILTEHVDTGVAEMINSDTLYSTVVLGSKEQDLDGYFTFTPFLSTFQEQYAMSYRSNVNKELDLQMQAFITDSNLIYYTQTQQGLTDPDSGNDDEVFYVVCRRYNGIDWDEKASLYFSNEYYLNEDISNTNVLINNFNGLPASVFKQYISVFATGFYANSSGPYIQQSGLINTPFQFEPLELIATTVAGGTNWNGTGTGNFGTGIVPSNQFYLQWDNDSVAPAFDGGGNYNNTTFEYTIPTTGFYILNAVLDMLINNTVSNLIFNGSILKLNMWKTDSTYSTGGFIQFDGDLDSSSGYTYVNTTTGQIIRPITMQLSNTIPVLFNATEKIFLTLEFSTVVPVVELYMYKNSHFTLTFTNVEGGDIVEVQDGNNYLLKNEWTGNVPLPNWQQILAAPFSQLRYQVNDAGEQRNMWVLDMTRKILSGVTDAQLTGRLVDEVPPNFESGGGGEGPEEEEEEGE
jgi:hypothetical protein